MIELVAAALLVGLFVGGVMRLALRRRDRPLDDDDVPEEDLFV